MVLGIMKNALSFSAFSTARPVQWASVSALYADKPLFVVASVWRTVFSGSVQHPVFSGAVLTA